MTIPPEGETRNPSDREFYLFFIEEDRIPSDLRDNEIITPDYKPLAKFLAAQLPRESALREALEHPRKGYAFRGLQRSNDPQLLKQVIDTIEEFGIDREGPHGNKTWFETSGDISYAMDLAMPRDSEHTGFLIVSKNEGMYQRRRSWIYGTAVKPGHTFKSLHIGTIAFRVTQGL